MNASLHDKLNAETAQVAWSELERHFARGATLTVGPELDLLQVAQALAQDDTERVTRWLAAGELERTTAEQAGRWAQQDATLWCVVVAPWVLVSEN